MTYRNSLPSETHGLTEHELSLIHAQVGDSFRQTLTDLQIDNLPDSILNRIYLPLAAALTKAAHEPEEQGVLQRGRLPRGQRQRGRQRRPPLKEGVAGRVYVVGSGHVVLRKF